MEHMVLLCEWARQAWFCSPLSFRFDKYNVTSIEAWWLSLFEDKRLNDFDLSLVASICWNLWKDICKMVFENTKLDPIFTVTKACSFNADYWEANGWKPADMNSISSEVSGNWKPPEINSFKANVDGAFVEGSNRLALG